MEADVLALRITVGLHQGALIRLDTADLLVIGSSDDCDVILADAGVASHHCVLQKQGDRFFLRVIEGATGIGGRALEPGATILVGNGIPVTVGSAALEIVSTAPMVAPPDQPPQATRAQLPLPRKWRVPVAVGALIATVFAVRAISLGISARAAQEAAGRDVAVTVATARSGASIAHDVAGYQ